MTFLSLAQLFLDHLLIFFAAAVISVRFAPKWISGLSWARVLAIGLTLIIGQGLLLGYTGLLGRFSFTLTSALVLAWFCLGASGKSACAQICDWLNHMPGQFRQSWAKRSGIERILVSALIVILLIYGVLALIGPVLVYDSLTYRLPRIVHWLQTGSIQHFDTLDTRQNYMPPGASLLMLWLTKNFSMGFPFVHLAQFYGGLLLLSSLNELGRFFGFSATSRFAALIVAIGSANVAPQFMSSHTDLITSGFFAYSLTLLLSSLKAGRLDYLASIALAAAFCCKGTLFYLVPAMAFAVLALAIAYRPTSFRLLGQHALIFLVAFSVLVLPRHIENQLSYGNPFASDALMEMHHPDLSIGQRIEKTYLNAWSYGLQNLDPNSNPPLLSSMFRGAGHGLTEHLPEGDPYLLDQTSRKQTLDRFLDANRVDADVSASGIFPIIWTLIGLIGMLGRPAFQHRWLAFILFLTGLIFLLFFCSEQNWHLYAYRYFILLLPFVFPLWLLAFTYLEKLSSGRLLLIVILPSLVVSGMVVANTHQVGLRPMRKGLVNRDAYLLAEQRQFVQSLPDTVRRIAILLPHNSPTAGFVRSGTNTKVNFIKPDMLQPLKQFRDFFDVYPYDALIIQGRGFEMPDDPDLQIEHFVFYGTPDHFYSFTGYYLKEDD